MIRKTAGFCMTAILTLGLAACNNQDRSELNEMNDNENGTIGVNFKDRHDDLNDMRNVRNDNINMNEIRNNDNLDDNLLGNKRKRNSDDMISAYNTNKNSDNYPHTRAVLVEDAKYQYIPINPGERINTNVLTPFAPYFGQQAQIIKPPVQHAAPEQTQPVPKQVPKQDTKSADQSQQAKQTQQPQNQTQQTNQQQTGGQTGTISQYAQQVVDLTNAERRKKGLANLKMDTQLSGVAQKKADDMQQNHYFSHTSPTYGSPFDMMRDFGVTYKAAGENIAQGQRTPQEVVNAWMNSEGHRANILSTKYTHIGVGFETAGKHWSQMFIGK
ncbi:CAP domain-containing protein [Bacillus rubiinfantis]|uniref:CAP domain-containing protein n=1 Tax=Bacillus rubiinfantis TaxID=1499680 RepID=UPI001FEB03F6|nr:CAP domain-containing protein [Bacillus rubiinfantis]